ncbi:MAG: C69 family dipeptidase [Candidatus Heimdallarchaeaceae archaeon]|jgi:dipeptidase
MCDTIVAVGNSTKDGSVIFGKNSDRDPNEVHNVEYIPRKKHKSKSKVKCTHISIPQVEETFAVLLMKPYWMFGCEMGTNEFGVTMGNEAVWSKEPIRKTGLLGMDMMRLALERSKTAREALEIITNLLEKHGQGGLNKRTKVAGRLYQNSFLIADSTEAWVLETADKFWIAEKVKDVRTTSNTLSIGSEYDLIHPNLIQHARDKGYYKAEEEFHFANCFIPKFRIYHALLETQQRSQFFAGGEERQKCTTKFMLRNKGKITAQDVMAILRDHNISTEEEENWIPSKATANSVCHHATGITVPDQTTGSHVAQIKKNIQVHWVTGSSSPCIGIFKPIFMPKPGISTKQVAGNKNYNPENMWWQHEKLHRLVLLDYQFRLNLYEKDRNKLENKFVKQVNNILKNVTGKPKTDEINEMDKITINSLKQSKKKTNEWIERVQSTPITSKTGIFYRRFWNFYNKQDKIFLEE